jgi:hypothetical protein
VSNHNLYIIGADTETCEGPPITYQFYSPDKRLMRNGCDHSIIMDVDSIIALETFIDYLDRLYDLMDGDGEACLFIHNLKFDAVSFFYNYPELLAQKNRLDVLINDWKLTGVYGTANFMCFSKGLVTVRMVDTYSWFKSSIAAAGEMVCPELPKLEPPANLGSIHYTSKDKKFADYAMRDAVIAYNLGLVIHSLAVEFDIPTSNTLPGMAVKIFRKLFVKYPIHQPPDGWSEQAHLSYHGGVNRVKPSACMRCHEDVISVDISSAYPYAMSLLPAFSNPDLYKEFRPSHALVKKLVNVPPLGVYRVSGTAKKCAYPCLFTEDFKPIEGHFPPTWIQGHEINEGLRSGELIIKTISGLYYDSDQDQVPSPFKAYTDYFYKLKEEARDQPIKRQMYKVLLNALYGKLIELHDKDDDDLNYADLDFVKPDVVRFVAGPLYHPFAASAITAHTRVYAHRIDHQYKSIHTATDGIIAPFREFKPIPGYPRIGLGNLTMEYRGAVMILRNKLYVFYTHPITTPAQKKYVRDRKYKESTIFKDRYIIKDARHGFIKAGVDVLERLIYSNSRVYTYEAPNTLLSSLRSGYIPNKFVESRTLLKIPKKMITLFTLKKKVRK